MRATVPAYDEVWNDPRAITNIFSFAEKEDKHPMICDTNNEHAFIVQLSDKQVRFKRDNDGLYIIMSPHIQNNQICATKIDIDSIEENMVFFKTRKKFYHIYIF